MAEVIVRGTVESVLREEQSLRWEGFEKQLGFKLAAKEWGSYGWWEWWINRGRRCDRRKKWWVRRL